jgi:hypothetical protein
LFFGADNSFEMKRLITNKSIVLYLGIIALGMLFSFSVGKNPDTDQKVASDMKASVQKAGEWMSLFDGKTLTGWKRFNADEIGPLWSVENGTIKCDGKGHGEGSGEFGGSLMTLEKFGNFELELEWRISEKGNSGILYHVVEKPEYTHDYVTGPEYQVADDPLNPGSPSSLNKRTGSCYDMYAASPDKKLNPVMEWNSSRIVWKDGKVEHWLNGQKVVEYDENSQDFKDRYSKSKWSSGKYPDWNAYKVGSISLQDHGAVVWYRNIKIKRL